MIQQRRTHQSNASPDHETASQRSPWAPSAEQSNAAMAEQVAEASPSLGGASWLVEALGGSDPKGYALRKGDTLWSLAKQYDTTVDGIIDANKTLLTTIRPGQMLKIPGQGSLLHCVQGADATLERKADTLYSIARQYGVPDWRDIVAANLPVGLQLSIPGYQPERDDPRGTEEPSHDLGGTESPASQDSGRAGSTDARGPSVRFEMPKAPVDQGTISAFGRRFTYAIVLTGRVTATAEPGVIMSQQQLAIQARTAFTESFASSLQVAVGPDGVPALTSTLMSSLGSHSLSFNGLSFVVDYRTRPTMLEFGGYDWNTELGLRLELTPQFEPKGPAPAVEPLPAPSPGGQGYWAAVALIIGGMFAVEVGGAALAAILEGPSPVAKLLALGLSIGVIMQIFWNWGDIDAKARSMA